MRPALSTTLHALALLTATAAIAPLAGAATGQPASRTATTPPPPTTPAATTPPPTTPPPAGSTRVSASLRYVAGTDAEVPVWSDIRITITRNGVAVADQQPFPDGATASYFKAPVLVARDLDGDAEPEVLVDIFTADYDCCRRTVLFRQTGHRYEASLVDWGAGSYRLANVLGGPSPEFVSSDARFPALFKSKARGPLRVQRFDGGRLVDVSRKARVELARDARRQARAVRHLRRERGADTRPAVAAYAVDLVRLGRVGAARRAIRGAAEGGELHGTARRFARRLDRQMVAWGYGDRAVLAG